MPDNQTRDLSEEAESVELLPCPIMTKELRRLIIAGRIVAYDNQSFTAIRALDRALEKFAGCIPWEDEPEVPTGCIHTDTLPQPGHIDQELVEAVSVVQSFIDLQLESGNSDKHQLLCNVRDKIAALKEKADG